MNSINKVFFRGFFTLLPVAITIYIVYSAVLILENILGSVLRWILPEHWYIPGFGFLLTLSVIFAFGLMLNHFLTARILNALESRLLRVPFINAIYSPLKDLMNLFARKDSEALRSVVLAEIAPGVKMLGIVTRENFEDLHLKQVLSQHVSVYFPFSYGMGGYTLLIRQDQLTAVDLPIEKAMSLAITGWVKAENKADVQADVLGGNQ